MSRSIPPALASYMQGNGLHMGWLTKVGPLPDASYRYFSHQTKSYTYDDGDGSQTYVGRTGMEASAFVSASDMSVDNSEVNSLPAVDGYELEGFTTQQVMSGVLDGVRFVTYCVNYTNLSLGHFIWAKGTIGEQRIKGTAIINLEQRSITNKLKQVLVRVDSRDCRAIYGSQAYGTNDGSPEEKYPCGIDLSTRWSSGTVSDTHPTDTDKTFYSTSFGAVDGAYRRGMVRAITGANAGQEREVEEHSVDGLGEATITVLVAFPYPFEIGDQIDVRDGCSKSPSSCRDETRWGVDWVDHFRGEPWQPVGDAGAVLIGGPAVPGDLGGTGELPTGPEAPAPTPPGGNDNPGSPTARTIGATNIDASISPYNAGPTKTAAQNVTAINAALAALPAGGGTVYFSVPGAYAVNTGNTSGLIEINTDNTRLNLDGITLQATDPGVASSPSSHRDVIRIDGATEVEVVNGRITGYRDSWTNHGGESAYGVSEWAHGIFVTGSSSAVTIKDITITKCVGDCISVGFSSNDVWIDNCILSYARRQGVSNGGDNLKVTNCNIHHISGASNGPCAGIDCEPDDPATAVNITVTGNTIEDCSGPAVLVWLDSSNITIEDNPSLSRCSRAVLINAGTTGTFKGNTCLNNRNPAKFQSGSTGWVIGGASANDADNNVFKGTGTTNTSGNTTTLYGESSNTSRHLDIDNSSSASVLYNKYG